MKIISKLAKHGAIVPEYIAKVGSVPAGALTAGAKGNSLEKMTEGVKDLFTSPINIYNDATQFAEIAKDYNTQTVREFTQKYGSDAANALIGNVQGAIDYGNQLASNFSDQPIETGLAVGAVTGGLYGVGRLIKFIRTKGQGGILTRFERKLGNKIFKK